MDAATDARLPAELTVREFLRPGWPPPRGEVRGKAQPVRLYAYGTGSEAGERPRTVAVEE